MAIFPESPLKGTATMILQTRAPNVLMGTLWYRGLSTQADGASHRKSRQEGSCWGRGLSSAHRGQQPGVSWPTLGCSLLVWPPGAQEWVLKRWDTLPSHTSGVTVPVPHPQRLLAGGSQSGLHRWQPGCAAVSAQRITSPSPGRPRPRRSIGAESNQEWF